MAEEKFAFETGKVSIAFNSISGAMGDVLIAKSVFDAIVKLVPHCKIDVYFTSEMSKNYVKAFYGNSENLNAIVNFESYTQHIKKYDAAIRVWHMVLIDSVNFGRLQNFAPNLLKTLHEIDVYNRKSVYNTNEIGVVLRNITRAHILGINRYTCLSCGGALPIHDNHVEISLSHEGKTKFRKLKLRNRYITIGSNLSKKNNLGRHTLKEWSMRYATEYISLLNRQLPQVQVIQIGGGG